MRWFPVPRVLVGELAEPTHQPLTRPDRILPQTAGRLLRTPALQHRLEHRVLRAQRDHTVDELEMRRTRQINPPQPASNAFEWWADHATDGTA
jgi:hypothetical protein